MLFVPFAVRAGKGGKIEPVRLLKMHWDKQRICRCLDGLSQTSLGVLLVVIPFERDAQAMYLGSILFAIVSCCLRILIEQGTKKFVGDVIAIYVGILIIAVLLLRIVRFDDWGIYVELFFRDVAPLLFLIVILLRYLPVMFIPDIPYPYKIWFKFSFYGMLFLMGLQFLSSFSGVSPEMSFYHFRHELGLYMALFLVALFTVTTLSRFRGYLRLIVIVGLVVAVISILENVLYYSGVVSIRDFLLEHEFIRTYLGERIKPVRSQFPFYHHNRLGFYLVSIVFFVIAFRGIESKRFWSRWYPAAMVIPAIGLVVTFTRSAVVACLGGLLIIFLLSRWYRIIGLILIIGIFLVAAPQSVRNHYLTIFQETTYRESDSTAYGRLVAWDIAREIIIQYPFMGIGYGWRNFEFIDKSTTRQFIYSHCHNSYLEIACESGILAMFVFVFSYLSIIVLYVKAWLRMPPIPVRKTVIAWTGLLCAIGLYMFTNYIFRYSLGVFMWILLAVTLRLITLIPLEGDRVESFVGEKAR